ncbi:MAG: undecaprenyldiphospho-muramoylpentapeptide beta-N-acetylglucosaminyltransferase [Polyangiaceae bacterium]|nr:undecaprenyldiphospho-muramoylpentapeptide beta-N-acetylglucosaminyltransferase [Polyangiaceae bacterium]
MNRRSTVIIAGGGTGGHVFPGVAVAEALEAGGVEVVFCGTERGLEARVIPARGWRLERLDVSPMQGGGLRRVATGAVSAARATAMAIGTVRRIRPRAVLGVGGYAAGPLCAAAAALGVPLAVLEPNSVVGLANRILAPFARRAYIAWDEAARAFRPRALRRFGVPLRRGFVPRAYDPGRVPRVLVMGGSQGAQAINDALPAAVGRLTSNGLELEVVHQTGRGQLEDVRAAYAQANVPGATVVPFIDDVAGAIAGADLVVARAGAVTVAEITAIGRPAVLVPFPHAADDHQAKNAQALERLGAAVSVSQAQAGSALGDALERLLSDEAVRRAMAHASRAQGRPDAARNVASDLLAMAGA